MFKPNTNHEVYFQPLVHVQVSPETGEVVAVTIDWSDSCQALLVKNAEGLVIDHNESAVYDGHPVVEIACAHMDAAPLHEAVEAALQTGIKA